MGARGDGSCPHYRPLDPPGVTPGSVAPEGANPTPGRLLCVTAPSEKPQGFRGRGIKGEEVLSDRCKTPFRTSVAVLPGLCSPEMDCRRVPDTLPHSTSSLTQASPVLLPGECKWDLSTDCPRFDSDCVHKLFTLQVGESVCARVHPSDWHFFAPF